MENKNEESFLSQENHSFSVITRMLKFIGIVAVTVSVLNLFISLATGSSSSNDILSNFDYIGVGNVIGTEIMDFLSF